MKTLLYILANGIYAFLTLSIFLGYFALKHYSYTISDNGEDINLLGKVIIIATCIIAIIITFPIGIFAYRNFDEVLSRSDKYRSSKVDPMQKRIKHSFGIAIASFFTFVLTIPSIFMFVLSVFIKE